MKTLIIGPSWVGDTMMSQSLYRTLKKYNNTMTLEVMAPAWSRGVLTKMPEVDGIIDMPIGHGKFALRQRYQLGKTLRANQYDQAIVLPNSFKSALIPLFARIPKRTGWLGEMRYGVLNDHRRLDKTAFPLMVEQYVALAFNANQMQNADDIPAPLLWPKLTVSEKEIQAAQTEFHLNDKKHLIAFCPGAEFGPAKRWPTYHYTTLANALIEQGAHIVIFGSANDHTVGEEIVKRVQEPDSVTNLAGKTTLEHAIDLLAGCEAVVTNDSGLMHIAAALNRPLVALYGPSSPDFTPPLSNQVEIIRLITGFIKVRQGDGESGYHQSLIDIDPRVVFEKVMELVKQHQLDNKKGQAV